MFANKSFGPSARDAAESRKIREGFPDLEGRLPLDARNRGRREIPPTPADKSRSPDPIAWRELLAPPEALTGNSPVGCLSYTTLPSSLLNFSG
jgi:hypothetical protein